MGFACAFLFRLGFAWASLGFHLGCALAFVSLTWDYLGFACASPGLRLGRFSFTSVSLGFARASLGLRLCVAEGGFPAVMERNTFVDFADTPSAAQRARALRRHHTDSEATAPPLQAPPHNGQDPNGDGRECPVCREQLGGKNRTGSSSICFVDRPIQFFHALANGSRLILAVLIYTSLHSHLLQHSGPLRRPKRGVPLGPAVLNLSIAASCDAQKRGVPLGPLLLLQSRA